MVKTWKTLVAEKRRRPSLQSILSLSSSPHVMGDPHVTSPPHLVHRNLLIRSSLKKSFIPNQGKIFRFSFPKNPPQIHHQIVLCLWSFLFFTMVSLPSRFHKSSWKIYRNLLALLWLESSLMAVQQLKKQNFVLQSSVSRGASSWVISTANICSSDSITKATSTDYVLRRFAMLIPSLWGFFNGPQIFLPTLNLQSFLFGWVFPAYPSSFLAMSVLPG